MSTATAYATLERIAPVLTTQEAAAALRAPNTSASRALAELERKGLVRKIRHGLWSIGSRPFDPRTLVEELTRPYPAYVSFQSALAAHGAIDQIPREIAVASLEKAQRIETPFATFAIHRIPPRLFGGFEITDGIPLANAEKALFDYIYVACASGEPSRRIPELDLPARFSRKELAHWTERIASARLRSLVSVALADALKHAEYEDAGAVRRR